MEYAAPSNLINRSILMSDLLLYKNPIPLDATTHKHSRLKLPQDYAFAAETHYLPLAAIEFSHAARDYPIIFLNTPDGNYASVAMVGLKPGKNLMVDDAGKWAAGCYVPAYVRRYPFVPSLTEKENELIICIDEGFSGFNDPEGELIFTEDGKPAPLFDNAIELLKDYHVQNQRTELFCKTMKELRLFKPLTANLTIQGGQDIKIEGLQVIDEEKLQKITDEQALSLFRTGQIGMIYSHLLSLANIARLGEKMVAAEK